MAQQAVFLLGHSSYGIYNQATSKYLGCTPPISWCVNVPERGMLSLFLQLGQGACPLVPQEN
jgi:hypothetical protein